MTKKSRTAHQAANDEIADKIVAGVKSGKLAPDKRGKVPYDQDMAEKEIRESLDKRIKQGGIRVNIDDFELDQLKVKVKNQYHYKTEKEARLSEALKVNKAPKGAKSPSLRWY